MIKLSFYLDKRNKLVDETFAVRLRVSIKGKGYILIPTSVSVRQENWLDGRIIGSRLKDAQNSLLTNIHTKVYDLLAKLEVSGDLERMNFNEIKAKVLLAITRRDCSNKNLVSVQFESFISRAKKKGTAGVYTETLKKLSRYFDLNTLTLDEQYLGSKTLNRLFPKMGYQ